VQIFIIAKKLRKNLAKVQALFLHSKIAKCDKFNLWQNVKFREYNIKD